MIGTVAIHFFFANFHKQSNTEQLLTCTSVGGHTSELTHICLIVNVWFMLPHISTCACCFRAPPSPSPRKPAMSLMDRPNLL